MLTPQQLQRMPKRLMQVMDDMEADILRDICRRLRLSGTVTESALHQMTETLSSCPSSLAQNSRSMPPTVSTRTRSNGNHSRGKSSWYWR